MTIFIAGEDKFFYLKFNNTQAFSIVFFRMIAH